MTAIGAVIAIMLLAIGIGLGTQLQQTLAVAFIKGFMLRLSMLIFVFPSLMCLIYLKKN